MDAERKGEVYMEGMSKGLMHPECYGTLLMRAYRSKSLPLGSQERCTTERPHGSLKGVRGEALCSI